MANALENPIPLYITTDVVKIIFPMQVEENFKNKVKGKMSEGRKYFYTHGMQVSTPNKLKPLGAH